MDRYHERIILEVTTDGIVGKNTLSALNSYEPQAELFGRIKQARLERVGRYKVNVQFFIR